MHGTSEILTSLLRMYYRSKLVSKSKAIVGRNGGSREASRDRGIDR
jgi:hypothetical protein